MSFLLQATLNAGLDLRQAVSLPEEEEYNDWVAVHVVDFFNRINVIYGTVQDFCTHANCPMMSGGPKFEYYWADESQKKPQAVSAPTVSGTVLRAWHLRPFLMSCIYMYTYNCWITILPSY